MTTAVVIVKEQTLPVDERCPACGGVGAIDCGGGGGMYSFMDSRLCSVCHGAGYISVQLVDEAGKPITPAI